MAAPVRSTIGVRAWRRRFRRARKEHHRRSWGEILSDLYTLLWFVLVYGTALYSEVGRALETPAAVEGAAARVWLGLAALSAAGGLVWMALRAVGPMLATDAERSWIVSTPLDRRGWLAPRFLGLLACTAALAAMAGVALAFVGAGGRPTEPVVLAGALLGLALPAVAVLAQGPGRRRWPAILGPALLTLGAALAIMVIVQGSAGRPLPEPRRPVPAPLLALAGLGVALVVTRAWTALARLDRRALGSGAPVAAAAVTSAIWLDPRLLGEVLELRRWRRVGRVRSRSPGRALPGVPPRVAALLRAEVIRLGRRPRVLLIAGGLVLVQYAIAMVAPPLSAPARLVLAYLVAGRLMAGLRAVAGSPGLRRSVGGRNVQLHLTHLVLPSLVLATWWVATVPTNALAPGLSTLLLLGVVGAAYRAATRGPLSYGGAVIETPMGLVPVDLLVSLARGPDLLGATLLLGALLG